jgi:adenylate cyclase
MLIFESERLVGAASIIIFMPKELKMSSKTEQRKKLADELWYWYLTGEQKNGFPKNYERLKLFNRKFYGILPGDPRCFECNLPLSGSGARFVGPLGLQASRFSPQLCGWCESSIRKMEGGAEIELTMLFADVRGSTSLAEKIGINDFTQMIKRFYKVATDIILQDGGMVNRLMGDQVIGLFVPRFSGSNHAMAAIDTAKDLLMATGHQDEQGPWAPVGVGIHTGPAYVGTVGHGEGVNEIAVLGSAANLAARLSSEARQGEVLISQDAMLCANHSGEGLQHHELDLKGISGSVAVQGLRIEPHL